MANIFEDGIRKKVFVDLHPTAIADILWSLFSGIVLWETSKKLSTAKKIFKRNLRYRL
jgi:hypothetical protein